MTSPKAQVLSARAERRAMIAVVTVFVLLVQALIPSLAAAGTAPGGGLSICTESGLVSAPDERSAPASAGHDCQHCVCPAVTAEPPPVASMRAVVYAVSAPSVVDTPRGIRPQARAPPRPPGQGPPLPNA